MMKYIRIKMSLIVVICAVGNLATLRGAFAYGEMHCGLRPLPSPGCHIGRCVNGQWEEICGGSYGSPLSCGLRPLPAPGCHIGRCVNGEWEQICN